MNDIFQSVLTREELQQFIFSLEEIDKAFFTVHANIDATLSMQLDYIKRDSIVSHFTKNNLDIHNPQIFHEFVQQVITQAKKLPMLTITLSYSPTRVEIEEIIKWLYLNTEKQFVLDVQVNPSIVGGSILGYNGQYKDLSVKKKVQEYFAKHAQQQEQIANSK